MDHCVKQIRKTESVTKMISYENAIRIRFAIKTLLNAHLLILRGNYIKVYDEQNVTYKCVYLQI